MSVIATAAEPGGVTRIFFDCRLAEPEPGDLIRITRAIEHAAAMAAASVQAKRLPRAA